jgi:hypothetical protein
MSAALGSSLFRAPVYRESGAPVQTIGELQARPPRAGFMVVPAENRLFPVFSYNPRLYAASRRKWARDMRAQFAQLPCQAFLTTTMAPEWHGLPASREMLACEAEGHRLFKQSVDRFVRSMCDVRGRCTDCIHSVDRCRRKHSGVPWRVEGRCAQCGRWRRLAWWVSRQLFACSVCVASPRLPAYPLPKRKKVPLPGEREGGPAAASVDVDDRAERRHRIYPSRMRKSSRVPLPVREKAGEPAAASVNVDVDHLDRAGRRRQKFHPSAPFPKSWLKPRSFLNWGREMENDEGDLDNPHRHIKALMPYIPQEVLSELAARAHLARSSTCGWIEKERAKARVAASMRT